VGIDYIHRARIAACRREDDHREQIRSRGDRAVGEQPRISVIVPTFQRRELVAQVVESLSRQAYDRLFEVVVVVDGSTDGTEAALRASSTPFSLRVVSQPNRGAARARNRGAMESTGAILLFLDDDMIAEPRLLAEHDRSHAGGADVVFGAIPLDPESPENFLSLGVDAWARELAVRFSEPGRIFRFDEIVTGQFSIRREVFEELGGFDERFTAGGSYGNEDLDLGYRLVRGGWRIVHNPRAVSRQRYVVDPAHNLWQFRQAGRADVALARKHPDLVGEIFTGELARSGRHRAPLWPMKLFPRLSDWATRPLGRLGSQRIRQGRRDRVTKRLFLHRRALEYWLGVREAGGPPVRRGLRVLCYHAIQDLGGDPVLASYGVPAESFAAQFRTLARAGYQFVRADEVSRFLSDRAGLPRKAVFLTFDDGYRDLPDAIALVDVSAAVFVVSAAIGAENDWDQAIGANALGLLGVGELEELARRDVEVGAHSRSHRDLTKLSGPELQDEVEGAAEDLEGAGLGVPRFFSYPYGEHNPRVREVVARAGYEAGFTVTPGVVHPSSDRYALPRIEIFPGDLGWRLRLKVATGGGPRAMVRSILQGRWRLS
jgi:glycosyltransferase involved in cell wall biosynthesis